ncbi:hypothetical protein ACN28I_11655 [Archangium gephyra]|uniref:hypothetical protein n=1 Tax=Archangium gephyra TaxID=48 RepID=UPI003B804970
MPRIELHGPAPLAASAPAPHAPGAVSQETARLAPSSATPAERSTRVVRILSGARFQAQASAPSGAPATFQAQQDSVTHTAHPTGSEAASESSSGPTVPRIELHGPAPLAASAPAPHAPGALSQEAARQAPSSAASVERSTRVVRLLPAAHFATFQAQQDSATHDAFPLASEATGESSSGPTVPRIEVHGPAPLAASAPAPHSPGSVSQEAARPAPSSAAPAERSTRVVRLLSGAHFQAQASAPSGAPATFRAQQDSATHTAPHFGSEASNESSSGPTVPRIEVHGPAPLAVSEVSRPAPSSAAPAERSTRAVRPPSGTHPLTGQAHATGNSEQVPAPAHSSTGPGSSPLPARSTPSRTRLTFLPAPEASSPSIPMYPSPSGSGLLQQLTHAAPAVERASPSGRDTSNGNVPPAPSAPQAELDRRSLEDALVDILRETARRHGVEV